jgi:hypothetical protein
MVRIQLVWLFRALSNVSGGLEKYTVTAAATYAETVIVHITRITTRNIHTFQVTIIAPTVLYIQIHITNLKWVKALIIHVVHESFPHYICHVITAFLMPVEFQRSLCGDVPTQRIELRPGQ